MWRKVCGGSERVPAYLEQVSSLTTGGRAERSYWAERAPEVDVGEQRTGGQQQGGSLRESRRTLNSLTYAGWKLCQDEILLSRANSNTLSELEHYF